VSEILRQFHDLLTAPIPFWLFALCFLILLAAIGAISTRVAGLENLLKSGIGVVYPVEPPPAKPSAPWEGP